MDLSPGRDIQRPAARSPGIYPFARLERLVCAAQHGRVANGVEVPLGEPVMET